MWCYCSCDANLDMTEQDGMARGLCGAKGGGFGDGGAHEAPARATFC